MRKAITQSGGGVKIWRINFGYQLDSIDVLAESAEAAIRKVRTIEKYKEGSTAGNDSYWISGIELLAESDI